MSPQRRRFGNSVLFVNFRHWTCGYCGNLIKNQKPFSIVFIRPNPVPYILCSASCLKIYAMKLKAERLKQ